MTSLPRITTVQFKQRQSLAPGSVPWYFKFTVRRGTELVKFTLCRTLRSLYILETGPSLRKHVLFICLHFFFFFFFFSETLIGIEYRLIYRHFTLFHFQQYRRPSRFHTGPSILINHHVYDVIRKKLIRDRLMIGFIFFTSDLVLW